MLSSLSPFTVQPVRGVFLIFSDQHPRDTDDMAAFEVYAFNAPGRVRGIERHKLEPVLAVHIVDALDRHFVIAVADHADLAAVVHG